MTITDVRIKLVDGDRHLKASASVVLDDCFVIHNCKIIKGESGLFLSMPSLHATDRCPNCNAKNKVQAKFCNDCGRKLPKISTNHDGERKLYHDMCHPITNLCRKEIEEAVLSTYEHELYAVP